VRVRELGFILETHGPGWTFDNGDGLVLDCLIQVPHEIELDAIRRIVREDGEIIWG